MFSESMLEAKIAPWSSSSARSSTALVRLPLCARAMWPRRTRARIGCAFSIAEAPAVE
jgi:hypothetical protein